MPRRRRHLHTKLPRNFGGVITDRCRLRDLPLINQRPVHPAALPVRQDGPQNVPRVIRPGKIGRRQPHRIGTRQRYPVRHLQLHPPRQRRIRPPHAPHRRPRRQLRKVPMRQLQSRPRVNIPRNRQAGVGRRIVPPEKILHIIQAGRVQILLRTDGHPVVRMRPRKQRLLNVPLRHPVGPVLVALPPLVLHHIPLRVKTLLVQRIQQKPHPVRLQPQRQLQVVGRHILPVVRAVARGRPVQRGPDFLQRLKMTALVVPRPPEHNMLKKMGKPGAPRLLVFGTDVIPDIHRRHRNGGIPVQDDIQAVGEGMLFVGNGGHKRGILWSSGRRTVRPAGNLTSGQFDGWAI